MSVSSEEIKAIVRELIKERVDGFMSGRGMEDLFASAAKAFISEYMRADIPRLAQLLDICKSEIKTQSRAFVEKHAPEAIATAVRSSVASAVNIPALVTEEIRRIAAQDMGHQIAKRMRQFFTAVDKVAGTQE